MGWKVIFCVAESYNLQCDDWIKLLKLSDKNEIKITLDASDHFLETYL